MFVTQVEAVGKESRQDNDSIRKQVTRRDDYKKKKPHALGEYTHQNENGTLQCWP